MTDNTENLVLEQLRLIHNEVLTTRGELRQEILLLHQRMSVFEKHIAALVSSSGYHEDRYAALEQRMDRLESRLNFPTDRRRDWQASAIVGAGPDRRATDDLNHFYAPRLPI